MDSTFAKDIKVDIELKKTKYEKHEFMNRLKKNPDLLMNFSNDRLEKILQYFIDENNEKRKKLKKLN